MMRCSRCGEVLVSVLECSRGIYAPCHLFAPPVEEQRVAGGSLLSRDQRPSDGALLSAAGDSGASNPIAGTSKLSDPDNAQATEKPDYLRPL